MRTFMSCDLFLGVPINIASYATLLCLLCKEANLVPGNLSGTLIDCHIYENHIPVVKEQLSRTPTTLPNLQFKKWNGIYNWEATDIKFENYNPQGKLTAEVAI